MKIEAMWTTAGRISNIFAAGAVLTTLYFVTKHSGLVATETQPEIWSSEQSDGRKRRLPKKDESQDESSGREEPSGGKIGEADGGQMPARYLVEVSQVDTDESSEYPGELQQKSSVRPTVVSKDNESPQSAPNSKDGVNAYSEAESAASPDTWAVGEVKKDLKILEVLSSISLGNGSRKRNPEQKGAAQERNKKDISTSEDGDITSACPSCQESLRNVDDYVFEDEQLVKIERLRGGLFPQTAPRSPPVDTVYDFEDDADDIQHSSEPMTSSTVGISTEEYDPEEEEEIEECSQPPVQESMDDERQKSSHSSGRIEEAELSKPSCEEFNERGCEKSAAPDRDRNISWWLETNDGAKATREMHIGVCGVNFHMGDNPAPEKTVPFLRRRKLLKSNGSLSSKVILHPRLLRSSSNDEHRFFERPISRDLDLKMSEVSRQPLPPLTSEKERSPLNPKDNSSPSTLWNPSMTVPTDSDKPNDPAGQLRPTACFHCQRILAVDRYKWGNRLTTLNFMNEKEKPRWKYSYKS